MVGNKKLNKMKKKEKYPYPWRYVWHYQILDFIGGCPLITCVSGIVVGVFLGGILKIPYEWDIFFVLFTMLVFLFAPLFVLTYLDEKLEKKYWAKWHKEKELKN